MRIQVLGWSSERLRCPDLQIDLGGARDLPKISLIQMPNGTGKTTTLQCLRACFDGSAVNWSPEEVRGFFPPGEHQKDGLFSTRLLLNGTKMLTISLRFHYEDGIVSYSTTSGKSNREGFSPPDDVALFLNDRFSHLFVFDGELAAELLEGTKADAGAVIDTFFQLYLLKDFDQLAEQAFKEHAKRKKSVNPVGKARLGSELDALERAKKALQSRYDKARKQAAENTAQQKQLQAEVGKKIAANKDFKEKEKQAEILLANAEHQLQLRLQALATTLPNPFSFGCAFESAVCMLADSLDRLKLPDSSSKAFFEELVAGKECVCGRPLDAQHKETIRTKAKLILGDEIAGFLNAFKEDAKVNKGQSPSSFLADELVFLKQIAGDRDTAITQKNAIRSALAKSGDEEIRHKEQRLQKLTEELEEAKAFFEECQREPLPSDDIKGSCLKWFEREIQIKSKLLAELTGSLDFKRRTEKLQAILRGAYENARKALKAQTISQCNARLRKVLPLSSLKIRDIDNAILLASEGGLEKEGASTGETLAIGYVFLTTLLNGGTHQFPLIVDSPANPLDIGRRNQVARLIPGLCTQFIGFIISSERAGFVESLSETAPSEVRFCTAFRKTAATKHLVDDLPKKGALQTANGVLVDGKSYFMQFDLQDQT